MGMVPPEVPRDSEGLGLADVTVMVLKMAAVLDMTCQHYLSLAGAHHPGTSALCFQKY